MYAHEIVWNFVSLVVTVTHCCQKFLKLLALPGSIYVVRL